MSVSGYSKTPLWKKLGIKSQFHCYNFHPPDNYWVLIEGSPSESTWSQDIKKGPFDLMHVFVKTSEELIKIWPDAKKQLKNTGSLWVSWPKKTSSLATGMTGNDVREIGLSGGLVDVKVCAIDEDWSGLKFMIRKQDRPTHRP